MSDKSTSSLVVDISKLKEAVVKAEKAANAARAEFRKTTAGMDNWSKSTEGLNAKIKQLNTSVEAEKLKLESLEAEYKQIVEKEGESSAAAKAHQVKIDNQTASVIRAEKELQKYKDKLSDLESDYSKATQEISKQEDELEALKKEYSNIILTQDKSSEAAQEVAAKIGKLSTELQENKKALEKADSAADEFDNTLEKVEDSAEEAGDGFTVMKGALANLISRGIEEAASKLVDLGKEAINCFNEVDDGADIAITKTGAIGESAKDIKNSYKGVASQVTGDFTDIGSAVGEVNTRLEFTGDKLTECSTDFVKFAKVNDTDVTSAVRLVSRAMGDAGIETDNYGQLLDYLTVAGQKSGVSIDTLTEDLAKYGAPMRALGLDTKNSIALFSAWEKSGVNVQIAFSGMKKAISNWGKEGKDSRKEFQKTLKEIKACPSLAKATTKAIDIFGAKAGPDLADAIKEGRFSYEDMIEALDNSKGSLKSTYDSIEDGGDRIKIVMQKAKLKVADFAGGIINKYEPQITKAIDTGIEKGEKAVTWVIKNSDTIKNTLKPIGISIATIFTVNTVAKFGQSLGTIVAGLGKVKGMTGILAKAAPTPWTIAIGAGIGFVKTLHDMVEEEKNNAEALKDSKTKYYELTEEQKKRLETIKDTKEAMEESAKARKEEVDDELAISEHTEKQAEQLDKIIDKNGKVKKGYEDEAKVITTQLSEALGINIDLVDNQIKGYDDLRKSIRKAIAAKKAESVQNVYSEDYGNSIKQSSELLNAKTQAEKDAKEATEKRNEAEKKYYAEYDKWQRLAKMSTEDFDPVKEGFDAYTDLSTALQLTQTNMDTYWTALEKAKKSQEESNQGLKEADENYRNNQELIKNYDKLSEAIASGSIKEINIAIQSLTNNSIFGKLKSLTNECQKAGVKIPKAISDGIKSGKYAVPSSVEGMKKLIKFGELQKKAKNAGINIPKSITNGIKSGQLSPAKAVKQMNRLIKFNEALEKADLAGKKIPEKMMKGILSGKIKPAQAIETLSKNISGQTQKAAKKGSEVYSKEIDSTSSKSKAQKSSKNLAKAGKKGLDSVSTKSSGDNFVYGFTEAINNKQELVTRVIKTLGNVATAALNKSIESHSPSKATERTGVYFSQGFINGIKSLNKQVKAESKSLGGASLKGILLGVDDGKFSKVGEKLVTHFTNGINSQASNIVKTMKKLITDSIPKGSSSIKKAKEEFSKIAEQLTDSFTKSFEKGASKAVKKVEKAFESISEEYQDKYDEITQKQEDLQNTLSDYGELFERDDNGKIKLSNLNEQINYLRAYDTNIKALKSKVSNDLMGAITSMSAEDGADLAAKLLSLSPSELKAFDNAYQEKQKISSQIAKDYYSSEVQSLKDNFTKQIKKQLKVLKKDLKEVGKQAVDGFIKGFNSKNSKVNETVENWAANIVKTVKKQLKIKSPSRVFRYEVAGNIIDGFIKGIATRTRSAVKTMKEFSNKMTDSANISIGSAKRGMLLNSGGAVTNNNSSTYNFYQTNNSPKALSRLEIYRDTRNMIKFQAGLKGV